MDTKNVVTGPCVLITFLNFSDTTNVFCNLLSSVLKYVDEIVEELFALLKCPKYFPLSNLELLKIILRSQGKMSTFQQNSIRTEMALAYLNHSIIMSILGYQMPSSHLRQ